MSSDFDTFSLEELARRNGKTDKKSYYGMSKNNAFPHLHMGGSIRIPEKQYQAMLKGEWPSKEYPILSLDAPPICRTCNPALPRMPFDELLKEFAYER